MADKKTVLITGANRGIGLGLAVKFLANGHNVLAGSRHPDGARELWELEADYKGRCRIVELDVTSEQSLAALSRQLEGRPLDILVNNAGVSAEGSKPFPEVTRDACLKTYTVNAIGPLLVTQSLLGNLQAAGRPVVATLSSIMGSIAHNQSGGSYPYRMSKAAVNMWNRGFAADYQDIIAVVLHPGWVKTAMGGERAPVSIDASTDGLYRVISELTPKDSGKFFDFQGEELPW